MRVPAMVLRPMDESSSYSKQLLESLELFRRDDLFCDTVIVIGEQQLKAHSVVLAAASSVFRAALESNAEPGLHFLNLSGYEFEALEAAVHFIYTGKLEVGIKYEGSEKLGELLSSLEDLGISVDQFRTCETVFTDEAGEISCESLHVKVEECKDDKETESDAILEDQNSPADNQLNSCLGVRVIKKENGHDGLSRSGAFSTSQGQGRCLHDIETLARCPDNESLVLNEVTNGWVLRSETGIHLVEIPADILAEVQTGIHKQEDLIKLGRVSENSLVNTNNHENCEKSFSYASNSRSRKARVSGSSVAPQNVSDNVHPKDLSKLPNTQVQAEVTHGILPDLFVKKKKRQNLVCSTCGKTFGKIDHFMLHLRVHTGEKPYTCDICHKKFSFVNNLQRHMRSHTGDKRYLCHLCGSAFIQKTTLEDHISVHTKEKKHPCKICGKLFKSASCLRAHSKRHKLGSVRDRHKYLELADSAKHAESIVTDAGDIRFVCKICRKDYASKNSLAIHVQHHSSTKPFACNLCKKSFWQRAHLEIHERTHSGERPYTCNTCGKSFTYAGGLSTHIRLHTGEKPYKCDICSSAYTQQAHLKSHLRTHTGEKPFECKACGKKYRNKVDLRFHLKRNDSCNKMS